MRRLIAYLKYVFWHKWFLFTTWRNVGGVPFWRILIHDWTKFLPLELFSYAEMFYNVDGSDRTDEELKERFICDAVFNRAWLSHIHYQPHHWQHWVLIKDSGAIVPLLMPRSFVYEMVIDWNAANKAQAMKQPDRQYISIATWYFSRKDGILLHSDTRKLVESLLTELSLKGII